MPSVPKITKWGCSFVFDSPNESEVSAILRLKSGITGSLHLNGDSNTREQANFVILGTRGMLYLTDPNAFGGTVRFLPNILDFNVEPDFNDCVDGFVLLDFKNTPENTFRAFSRFLTVEEQKKQLD